jgi:hypothetical protein
VRSSQDLACCWRATSSARSKYVSALAASGSGDSLLGLAHYSGQQSVSELASYRRSDLRDLFGGDKPVEPRH